MKIRIPWRLKNAVSNLINITYFLRNVLAHRAWNRAGKQTVLVCVPFYGYTGGSFAVVSTGNLLAESFAVSFLTKPTNIMNRYVAANVRTVTEVRERYDFCIAEAGISPGLLAKLKQEDCTVILTMHGAPDAADGSKNHGYREEAIKRTLDAVDSVHFISDIQKPFVAAVPGLHHRKIPNYVYRVEKSRHGMAAGVVCDTTLPHKNAALSVQVSDRSAAERVEVWGTYANQRSNDRIRWNGFSSNKSRIYDSFDVLVHLSWLESQCLVVLEAISAGIPCVIPPLPAYDHIRDLEGIYFVDLNDHAAITAAVNKALNTPEPVRDNLKRFWEENHSPRAIHARWVSYLEDLRLLQAKRARPGN